MSARGKLACALVALTMAVGHSPAGAQESDPNVAPVNGRDTLLTGIYSDQWDSSFDLAGLSAVSPTPLSLAGTFHTLLESELGWGPGATDRLLEQVWLAKTTPVANVNVRHSAFEVARGDANADIATWSTRVRAWLDRGEGRSLLIAPMQEMNGNWVPYGMDPGNYRIAFRRFVEVARANGLDQRVRWVFAPNGWSIPPHTMADYYPGDDIVDFVGVSSYNFGALVDFWTPVEWAVTAPLAELRTFAPDKPYILAQLGSSTAGGDRDEWLAEMFRITIRDPNVVGLVYFNFDKETDWKVWRDHLPALGWVEGSAMRGVRHVWPLNGWFEAGPLPFKPYEGRFVDDDLLPVRDDIDWLAGLGVVSGCSEDEFCPDRILSRSQLAALLTRALGLTPMSIDAYPDDDGNIHEQAIDTVAAAGLMAGCDPKHFCPDSPATRDVLRIALDQVGTPQEMPAFAPTPDPAKATPICPTARYCQKQSLTRTYAAAAIGAFLRNGAVPETAPTEADPLAPVEPDPFKPWWLPPT